MRVTGSRRHATIAIRASRRGRRAAAATLAAAFLMVGCAQDEPAATASAVIADTTQTPSTTEAGQTTPLPTFPPERSHLEQGSQTWAVVLAGAASPDDPAIVAAEQAAGEAGYRTGWTDCDEGAAEALGVPDGTITTSVYFETEEDAQTAAAAFAARGANGVVAEVRTMCLD